MPGLLGRAGTPGLLGLAGTPGLLGLAGTPGLLDLGGRSSSRGAFGSWAWLSVLGAVPPGGDLRASLIGAEV
jgi:hypothetical protein